MDYEGDTPTATTKPSGGGSQWSTLFSLDLRTLSAQTLIGSAQSSGYYTFNLGGAPWTVSVGSSQATGKPCLAVVPGVGLVAYYASDKNVNNIYAGMHTSIRVTELPGYDPAKTTCCQMRLYRGPELDAPGYTFAQTMASVSPGRIGASVWSSTGAGGVNYSITASGTLVVTDPANTAVATLAYSDRGAPYSTPDLVRDWVFATMASPWSMEPTAYTDSEKDRNLWSLWYQRDVFSDSLPDVEDMQCAYTSQQAANGSAYANHKMGAYFGIPGGVSSGCAIRQVRVLQRAVKSL